MRFIVDTNVAKVANGQATPQASPHCVIRCVELLQEITQNHILVIDDRWLILGEYEGQLNNSGQPGVGDAFLKWVLTNRVNPLRCETVSITPTPDSASLVEFPSDPALAKFDPSDHKFVAAALAHPNPPVPILNAVDSDWWNHHDALQANGVEVCFLCPDAVE